MASPKRCGRRSPLGITFWDTANVYGAGSSEEIIGRALTATHRDDIALATKVHQKVGDEPGGSGLSRKAGMEQIDLSLQRLGNHYVDLYQNPRLHPFTPGGGNIRTLAELGKAGEGGDNR